MLAWSLTTRRRDPRDDVELPAWLVLRRSVEVEQVIGILCARGRRPRSIVTLVGDSTGGTARLGVTVLALRVGYFAGSARSQHLCVLATAWRAWRLTVGR